MSKHVWMANYRRNPIAERGYRPDAPDADENGLGPSLDAYAALSGAYERLDPIDVDELPSALFALKTFAAHRRPKRHVFSVGFTIVSSEVADVLRAHDLGATRLVPVELLHPNRKTRVEGEWFYLIIAETKSALRPEASEPGVLKSLSRDRAWFSPRRNDMLANDDIAVSPAALEGVDLWRDAALIRAPFLSPRLVKAIRAAKLTRHWDMRRCRVVT